MASFSEQVRKWAEKTGRSIEQTVVDTVVDISSKVVLRTPVGNPSIWQGPAPAGYIGGTLRNNWFASIGQPSTAADRQPSAAGTSALSEIIAKSVGAPGEVYYLVNNMPYANRIEYQGYSKQAPAGMVRLSVQEFKAAVDAAIRKNKKS